MLVHCNCTGYEIYDEMLAFNRLVKVLGDIVFGYMLMFIKIYLLVLDSTVVFTPNPQLLIHTAKLKNLY